jgi:hypothetical protein
VSACARAAPRKVHVAARSKVVRGSAPSDTLERVVECSWKEDTRQNPELLPGERDKSGGATVGRDSGNAAMSPARTQPVCARSKACLWRNSKRPRRGPPATARTAQRSANPFLQTGCDNAQRCAVATHATLQDQLHSGLSFCRALLQSDSGVPARCHAHVACAVASDVRIARPPIFTRTRSSRGTVAWLRTTRGDDISGTIWKRLRSAGRPKRLQRRPHRTGARVPAPVALQRVCEPRGAAADARVAAVSGCLPIRQRR